MILRDFHCTPCDHKFEYLCDSDEDVRKEMECPKCGTPAERVVGSHIGGWEALGSDY
jgi:putative FmdB family regulatory protein